MSTPYISSKDFLEVKGFRLQESPLIYVTSIPGFWLLTHTTPSWRIQDPDQGFQRVVREDRARSIANDVLNQRRTFPNAIVLATDLKQFVESIDGIKIPQNTRFLVVDGQHRLWAQKFSEFEAQYSCVIHLGLTEVEMARLFLEINDTQKRVPSSLRWDLVRLVRPEDDPEAIAAADIVLLLATEESSPLYQRIDLTGEQSEIKLKQGSLAPEIKSLFSKRSPINSFTFDQRYDILLNYIIAVKEIDKDRWGTEASPYYRPRVFRAILRLLPDVIGKIQKDPLSLKYTDFVTYLKQIDEQTLEPSAIRSAQGSAGMKALYDLIYAQIIEGKK